MSRNIITENLFVVDFLYIVSDLQIKEMFASFIKLFGKPLVGPKILPNDLTVRLHVPLSLSAKAPEHVEPDYERKYESPLSCASAPMLELLEDSSFASAPMLELLEDSSFVSAFSPKFRDYKSYINAFSPDFLEDFSKARAFAYEILED